MGLPVKEIREFTIVTDDPEIYLPYVREEIEYGYWAGYVDHANYWESKVIGYNEEEEV